MVSILYKSFPGVEHINSWLTDDAQMVKLSSTQTDGPDDSDGQMLRLRCRG